MPSSVLSRPAVLLTVPLLLATGALAGCGGDDSAGSSTKVAVEAGDDSCTVSETDLEAGDLTFAVENTGNKVTEVYVYAEDDGAFTKVVSEVENIGPGTSRDMDVDLAAGSYEVACKPGQSGDGIRQKIAVTGSGGAADVRDRPRPRAAAHRLRLRADRPRPGDRQQGRARRVRADELHGRHPHPRDPRPGGQGRHRVRRPGRRGRRGGRRARHDRRLDRRRRGRLGRHQADPHGQLTTGSSVWAVPSGCRPARLVGRDPSRVGPAA